MIFLKYIGNKFRVDFGVWILKHNETLKELDLFQVPVYVGRAN